MHEDINQIKQDVSDIKVAIGKIEVSLAEHMRRTQAAEEMIELLKKNLWIAYGALMSVLTAIGFYVKMR